MSQTGQRGPHWLVPTLVGIAITLVIGFFGFSDVRWRAPIPTPSPIGTSTPTQSRSVLSDNGSVRVKDIGYGGAEVTWRAVEHPELDHYSPTLYAFSPISTSLTLGYYSGDTTTKMRLFPFQEYQKANNGNYIEKYGDPPPDQEWVICFDAYKDIPMNVLATPYLIEEDICSDPFRLPE